MVDCTFDEHGNELGPETVLSRDDVETIVSISGVCLETMPCQHDVTICSKHGDYFITQMDAPQILWLARNIGYLIGSGNHLSHHKPHAPTTDITVRPIL